MNDYYILRTVEIIDGILTPEKIKEAKSSLPTDYNTVDDNPTVLIVSPTVANITFVCRSKNIRAFVAAGY